MLQQCQKNPQSLSSFHKQLLWNLYQWNLFTCRIVGRHCPPNQCSPGRLGLQGRAAAKLLPVCHRTHIESCSAVAAFFFRGAEKTSKKLCRDSRAVPPCVLRSHTQPKHSTKSALLSSLEALPLGPELVLFCRDRSTKVWFWNIVVPLNKTSVIFEPSAAVQPLNNA